MFGKTEVVASCSRIFEITHYSTIFLSDFHLGTKVANADRLLDFLNQHSCDRLFLVGDILDGWRGLRIQSKVEWTETHTNVLHSILKMAMNGTQIFYITGNHDEFLRKHSDLKLGNLSLTDEAEHTTASGKHLLVIHGDQFDIVTRYHHWVAALGHIGYQLLFSLNGLINKCRRRLGYGYWSLSDWAKKKVKGAVNTVGHFEEAVAVECKRRGFDGIVCGHIHKAEIREFGGITYYNCGDWVESCTALVEDEHGELHILPWPAKAENDVIPFPRKMAVGE